MNVVVSDEALEQLREIEENWLPTRAQKDVFNEELEELISLLASSPEMGTPWGSEGDQLVRRCYLKRSRYHVYYVVKPEAVELSTIWSAKQAAPPRFGGAKH
jgi:plasmid stabilization system protein ParE